MMDSCQHTIEFAQNIRVPESEDAVALAAQECIAALVGFAVEMVRTVGLDDQTSLVACKIGDERTYRLLLPKLETAQLPVT
jgi:hypothetical protein